MLNNKMVKTSEFGTEIFSENQKIVDSLLENIGTDTVSIEELYWNTVYAKPISLIFTHQEIISQDTLTTVFITYIKSGISTYETLLKNIIDKINILSTYSLTSNSVPGARLYLETASRCHKYKGNLYRYLLKLQPDTEIFCSARDSYCLAFLTDPLSDGPLFELYHLYLLVENKFSALFFAFKGTYGVTNPQNCSEILDDAVSNFLSTSATNDNYELYTAKRELTAIIQQFKNINTTIDSSKTSNLEASICNIIKLYMAKSFETVQGEFMLNSNKLTVKQSFDTDMSFIFSIILMILDVLRRTDSERFRSLLKFFSKIFVMLIENGKDYFENKYLLRNPQKTFSNNLDIVETPIDHRNSDLVNEDILPSASSDSDSESSENSYGVEFCVSEDDESSDVGVEYMSFNRPLVGRRKIISNGNNEKNDEHDENDVNCYCFLNIIKLCLDWFTSWPEVVCIIEEVCDTHLNDLFKTFLISLPNNDLDTWNTSHFYSEDFCLFGHPLFSKLHKVLDFNNIMFYPQNSINEEKYRIKYLKHLLSDDIIFKPLTTNSPVTAILKPWLIKKRLNERRCSKPRQKRHPRELRTRVDFTKNVENKSINSSSVSTTSTRDKIEKLGNMFTSHYKNNKSVQISEMYNRIHVVCFYSVLYDFSLIKTMIWGKTFRVIVPEASFNMIDDLKVNDSEARNVSKFIHENCYPKYMGFRLQKREEAQSLPHTKPPSSSRDKKNYKYIESILQTAISHYNKLPKDELVVVLITSVEMKKLFGSEDLLTSTTEQAINRGLLQQTQIAGIEIITKDDFHH
ncbi:hypothetical protein HZS_7650, partial [Henneguya salminicola]